MLETISSEIIVKLLKRLILPENVPEKQNDVLGVNVPHFSLNIHNTWA